jgi:hypothetical protein
LEVTTGAKEGVQNVTVKRELYTGPRGGYTVDVEVWVTVGREKSNSLKSAIQVLP